MPDETMNEKRTRLNILLALLCFALPLILDQATKFLAIAFLRGSQPVQIIPGLLQFTYVENTGAAWGLFSDKTLWLALLSVGALFFTVGLIVQAVSAGRVWDTVCFAVLSGGIVGNAIDRLFRGAVIDFIDVYVKDWHWPTFNIADSAITVAICLIVLQVLRHGENGSLGKDRAGDE